MNRIRSATMDEGDVEDVSHVSRAGKEVDFSPDMCRVLEQQQDGFVLREVDYPRSSVQQFVAIFDGEDPGSSLNEGPSQNPCNSQGQIITEGRVQELTLGHYNVGNEGDMMESLMSELHPANQTGFGFQAGSSSHEHHPAEQPCSDHNNANGNPGQSSYNNLSTPVKQNAFPVGGMRMKVINKSSGCPEYFVKSSLMGKGVLCRGPIPAAGVEFKNQETVNGGEKSVLPTSNAAASGVGIDANRESALMTTSSDPPVQMGRKSGVKRVTFSDPPVQISLRDWIKSGQSRLHKVDSLFIFKQILDLVYSLHSEGKVLEDLRPSSFRLLPQRKIKYCGRLSVDAEIHGSVIRRDVQQSQTLKRPLELGTLRCSSLGAKHQKFVTNGVESSSEAKFEFQLGCGLKAVANDIDVDLAGGSGTSGYKPGYHSKANSKTQSNSSGLHLPRRHAFSVVDQLEEKWYRSPEELFGRDCSSSSNVYSLGVFLFELLGSFDSTKAHAATMSDLRHRILPPTFLSENPKEAGFCLWLLHPEPSLRPTARDILQSEVVSGFQALCGVEDSSSIQQDKDESELLLHFLMSMKEQKDKLASKLVEDLGCIEADISKLEKRQSLSNSDSDVKDSRFLKNFDHLESAYFSMRSQIQGSEDDLVMRADGDILQNRGKWFSDQRDDEHEDSDSRGAFFDGLCKYARYSKLEVCGTLRNRDVSNSTNVICSLSFDRDESHFAAAGVAKKIKIYEFQSLYDDTIDIHYPVIEMSNKSRLSCVCWNKYIRNYLTSTDYDGIVKLWDASTGQAFSEYTGHTRRAWSVDFSPLDPTQLASGSDDCSVKLWRINEKNCLHSIQNIANVCCVQFSPHSSNLLAFGSADYKIYCYDLRNPNVPWCVLAGHDKAVSYVKFVNSATLVSASTDNTLKLWDLNRSSPSEISQDACRLTFSGHTNEKNFVGLSVADGYIACGSESNEVYTYHKSFPMPITSHKFGSIDPISGKETDEDNGQFVSSVCWKGQSNVVVAANSNGCIKVLRMV